MEKDIVYETRIYARSSSPKFSKMKMVPNEDVVIGDDEVVEKHGQRIYGGPPKGWIGPPPPRGCEIFVGKIPRTLTVKDLLPIFLKVGKVYELRLMMEFSGVNRGFCFIQYSNQSDAENAITKLDNYEISPGWWIGVRLSVDNRRLWIGRILEHLTSEELKAQLKSEIEGISDVFVFSNKLSTSAIIEFENHGFAATARRKLVPQAAILGQKGVKIEWANTQIGERNHCQKLKVMNVPPATSAQLIKDLFSGLGNNKVDAVEEAHGFFYVKFSSRIGAQMALQASENLEIRGIKIRVTWAGPGIQNRRRTSTNSSNFSNRSSNSLSPTNNGDLVLSCSQYALYPPNFYNAATPTLPVTDFYPGGQVEGVFYQNMFDPAPVLWRPPPPFQDGNNNWYEPYAYPPPPMFFPHVAPHGSNMAQTFTESLQFVAQNSPGMVTQTFDPAPRRTSYFSGNGPTHFQSSSNAQMPTSSSNGQSKSFGQMASLLSTPDALGSSPSNAFSFDF